MKIYIIIALVIILPCALYAMSGFFGYPTPPQTIKIDLSKSGNVYENTIRIRDKGLYDFDFKFAVKDSKEDNGMDRKKVREFTGGLHTNGTMIPVKLSIYRLNDDKKERIIDDTYHTNGLNGSMSNALIRRIKPTVLNKGIYHVRLETLEDFEFLNDREVFLDIRKWKVK